MTRPGQASLRGASTEAGTCQEGLEASVESGVQHISWDGSDWGREGMKKRQTHTQMEKLGLGELRFLMAKLPHPDCSSRLTYAVEYG